MVYYYTTLAQAKSELKAENTVSDNYVLGMIGVVSQRVDELLNVGNPRRPYFLPYTESRDVAIDGYHISGRLNTLMLDYPLLALTSVTLNTTDVTTNSRIYPPNSVPARLLQLDSSITWTYRCDVDYPINFATITGVWGYNGDYANAWQAVDAITVAGINASVTTFTVADADGVDTYGLTPRLSAGNYIKVDDEVMLVVAVNITTNTLTVKRGQLGTTSAIHALGASVSTYTVEPIISQVVARQVGKAYARRGAYDAQIVDGVGLITYPPDLLPELKNIVSLYLGNF